MRLVHVQKTVYYAGLVSPRQKREHIGRMFARSNSNGNLKISTDSPLQSGKNCWGPGPLGGGGKNSGKDGGTNGGTAAKKKQTITRERYSYLPGKKKKIERRPPVAAERHAECEKGKQIGEQWTGNDSARQDKKHMRKFIIVLRSK